MYVEPAAHVKLEIKHGLPADVKKFHGICNAVDGDWPFGNTRYSIRICKVCGGRIYRRPRLVPADIKAAARQCGVKVSVTLYRDGEKCIVDGDVKCDWVPDVDVRNVRTIGPVRPPIVAATETATLMDDVMAAAAEQGIIVEG